MQLNNKGFTLVEVLAVIVIIGLLAGIAIPNVLSSINTSKNKAKEIMINNIKTGTKIMFEEVNNGIDVYKYDNDGNKTSDKINISGNTITINLQTLVSNGYLRGASNDENTKKILLDPITNKNIGYCQITIIRDTSEKNGNKVSYTITNNSGNDCPSY